MGGVGFSSVGEMAGGISKFFTQRLWNSGHSSSEFSPFPHHWVEGRSEKVKSIRSCNFAQKESRLVDSTDVS